MANVEFKSYEPTSLQGEAQVLINFRPHNDYHGEFGFDWVRMGDTGRGGDKYWYRDIMGEVKYDYDKYGVPIFDTGRFVQNTKEYDHLVSNQFRSFIVPWKTKNQKAPFKYIIPYMSLLPNYSAKLKVIVEVKTEPDKYEIRYNENYFSVNELVAIPTSVGTKHINAALEIKCLKLFDRDQFIEIYAIKGEEETLAGKILVVSNAKKNQRTINVCFVTVEINKELSKVDLEKEKIRLRKYLRQAYIHVNIRTEVISFHNKKELTRRINETSDKAVHSPFYYLKTFGLQHQRKESYLKYNYDKYYCVFFLPFIYDYKKLDGRSGLLLGKSEDIPRRVKEEETDIKTYKSKKLNVLIFDLVKSNEELKTHPSSTQDTVTHELCHTMGLHHTFVNGSHFVFEEGKTDNIMDYHSHKEKINRLQLFRWQWNVIRNFLD